MNKPTTVNVALPGKGKVELELRPGVTARELLVDAAIALGLTGDEAARVVARLTPVVDSRDADLDDPVPESATNVAAAPNVALG